ncbi:MAG TPA: hypothetical protein VMK31_01710 [Sphingomicrobium sp.]|nr:hypothetical protein [Sphingomicrobium sp.]
MRIFLIPLAAAAATMVAAAPASAQWYPQPYQAPYAAPYQAPYAAPYGHRYASPNAYGNLAPHAYGNRHAYGNFAGVRAMQARAQNLRMQIRMLDRRNLLTRHQARSLEREARTIERQIARSARYRLNLHQYRAIDRRLVRLEMRVQQRVAMNMRHGYRQAYSYGYGYGRR